MKKDLDDTKLEEVITEIEADIPNIPSPDAIKPITLTQLGEILGLTIKKDDTNKLITFLCCISTFSEGSQFNVSYNAPSSSGKSYIPIELCKYFPDVDVLRLGSCSPTAFFHEQGAFDKASNTITVDLSRKLIVFIEMPNNSLLERLRPLLSHDLKEIISKITDKNQKGGNRTKTVIIQGYPAVIFCTAGLNIDEQELTRFIILSPEISQEKIRDGIHERISKESNSAQYNNNLENNTERQLLMERIQAIRDEGITKINIACPELIESIFHAKHKMLKPKHMRDIGKIMNIAKAIALLNLWNREREGSVITANEEDVQVAIELWDKIANSQEFGIPPYIYNFYYEIILPAWQDKLDGLGFNEAQPRGLDRQEVRNYHFKVRESTLSDTKLRLEILPMLEAAGLIFQEFSMEDGRQKIIRPALDVKNSQPQDEIYSVNGSGVNKKEQLISDVNSIFDINEQPI